MAQTILQSECEGLPAPGRHTAAGLGGAQVQERCGLAQSGQRGLGERGESGSGG